MSAPIFVSISVIQAYQVGPNQIMLPVLVGLASDGSVWMRPAARQFGQKDPGWQPMPEPESELVV